MLARRCRLLLKIRDKKTLLRSNPRNVPLNLKVSTCAPIRLANLNKSCFYTENVRTYSNLSEVCNEAQAEDSDNETEGEKNSKSPRMTENSYTYAYLTSNERYNKTIIPSIIPDEDIPEETVERILNKTYELPGISELMEDFRILSYHAKLTRTRVTMRHNTILSHLTESVKDMLDDQIWMLLRYLEMWYPMPLLSKKECLTKLEDQLDHECWKRALEWDANELLKTCDLFYHLRRSRYSKHIQYAVKKLGLKPSKMSADNYIHYMFLLNICRKPSINMYELEYRLETLLEEYSAEELAIIAMGFFKTQTPIRNPALVKHIIQKCTENMKDLGEIFVCAILKMSRQSVHLRDRIILTNLFQKFQIRIPTISTASLVHAAHAGATSLVYHKETIALIFDELARRGIADARLKEIERILLALMTFNYPKDHPLYDMAIQELRNPVRTTEIGKFCQTYSCTLMYLSMANIYPLDIIDKIMNPVYLRTVYKNNAFRIGREYLSLECGLKIEVPEYEGTFLPERIYSYIAKKHACDAVWHEDPSQRVQTYQKFLFEVTHYLKNIVGEKNYFIEQVLPHYRRADIMLCLDPENKFIEPQPMLASLTPFKIKYAPDIARGYKWFALVLATHNHTFYHTTEQTGSSNAKLRHLEACGYKPITIMLSTWQKVNEAERPEYLKEIVMKNISDNK